MKICHYNEGLAGAVFGEKLYPIGDALMQAGHLKPGHSMLEVIERLANEPAAMKCVRFAVQSGSSLPLAQAKLLAPILNPPAAAQIAGGLTIGASSFACASGSDDPDCTAKRAHFIAAGSFARRSITSSMLWPGFRWPACISASPIG